MRNLIWLLAATTAPLAWGQQSSPSTGEPGAPRPLPPQPVTATVGDTSERPDRDREIPERITEGAPERVADLDDSIPLPVPAVLETGPEGDVVVTQASGNPFVLGFAAGAHAAPAGEVLDPELIAAFALPFGVDRPAAETYAYAMFQRRITPERVAELEALGARVLGFHPHYALKIAAPIEAFDAIAAHPSVRWVGVAKSWQKVQPELAGIAAASDPSSMLEVYINLFDSDLGDESTVEVVGAPSLMTPVGPQAFDPDVAQNVGPTVWQSNGWMQRALEQRGVVIRSYMDRQRTFRAFVPVPLLEDIAALDFVQYVEAELQPEAAHDESTAMILSDRVRASYDGSTNEVAVTGIIDTGVDNSHLDIGVWGVGWDCTTSGAWTDTDGHGTHVLSSMLGRGNAQSDHAGNAPGLATWGGTSRLFNVHFLNGAAPCSWAMSTVFSVFENAFDDGTSVTERPHVINNSWGTVIGGNPLGTEFNARLVDDQVFDHDQVYVFAAGNEGSGSGTLRIEPSAKNALSVGNVIDYRNASVGDPGTLWTSSSRGPCGDGRFKPNVSAPGRWIRGVDANTSTGYANYSGTSMAAPHVTGVIGQLVDRWSYLRYRPHTIASLLMGTAMTKDNATVLTTSTHVDQYGAGRIEAYKAAYDTSEFSVLYNNNLTANPGTWYFGDFTVTPDVTRLVVVMHYIEPSASAGAAKALVNDWDLWVDQDPIEAGGNTGEWFAQQTTVDNTEIRILDNPIEGTWRWKAYPDSVTSSVKMSITVHAIYGDTTPSGSLSLGADDGYVQTNDDVTFSATATNSEYIASGVFLDTSGSSHALQSATTTLDDGTVTDLMDNPHGGYDVTLGDILYGSARSAEWVTRYSTEGVKSFNVDARSDNWTNLNLGITVTVDGTPPGLPATVNSSTHSLNTWSNNPSVTFNWTTATDALSGLAGYGISKSDGAPSAPNTVLDKGPGETSHTFVFNSSNQGRYFNIRTVDRSDNWSPGFANTGPYLIDVDDPGQPVGPNSTTHTVGVSKCDGQIGMQWGAAGDSHSGIAGYSVLWNHNATTTPNTTINTAGTTWNANLASSAQPWYFHIAARDVAGNWGNAAHAGPFFISSGSATNYCASSANSVGPGAVMGFTGSLSVSTNNLRLQSSGMPMNQPSIFFYGPNQQALPFGNGFLCVGGLIVRLPVAYSGSGTATYLMDNTAPPVNGSLTAGSTWQFQNWYRDPAGGGAFFNLSDALSITFCD